MIRVAVQEDIPNLVALFVKRHQAMGCAWSINLDRLALTFSQAIAAPESWLCLMGDDCLLLAVCFESPLGAGKLAQELCLCASPGNFDSVLIQYLNWARLKGCRAASLSCEQKFEVFERLYRRYGFTRSEMTTSKVL